MERICIRGEGAETAASACSHPGRDQKTMGVDDGTTGCWSQDKATATTRPGEARQSKATSGCNWYTGQNWNIASKGQRMKRVKGCEGAGDADERIVEWPEIAAGSDLE
jgi:hypothetical protein